MTQTTVTSSEPPDDLVKRSFGVDVAAVLNDDIKAAGDPAGIADISTVRERFHEVRWASWNIVRSVATTVAFGCLAWALVLHGRS